MRRHGERLQDDVEEIIGRVVIRERQERLVNAVVIMERLHDIRHGITADESPVFAPADAVTVIDAGVLNDQAVPGGLFVHGARTDVDRGEIGQFGADGDTVDGQLGVAAGNDFKALFKRSQFDQGPAGRCIQLDRRAVDQDFERTGGAVAQITVAVRVARQVKNDPVPFAIAEAVADGVSADRAGGVFLPPPHTVVIQAVGGQGFDGFQFAVVDGGEPYAVPQQHCFRRLEFQRREEVNGEIGVKVRVVDQFHADQPAMVVEAGKADVAILKVAPFQLLAVGIVFQIFVNAPGNVTGWAQGVRHARLAAVNARDYRKVKARAMPRRGQMRNAEKSFGIRPPVGQAQIVITGQIRKLRHRISCVILKYNKNGTKKIGSASSLRNCGEKRHEPVFNIQRCPAKK